MVNKYRNKKCSFGGHNFDSKKERDHYIYLLSEKQAGKIKDLELQPSYLLQDGFKDNQGKKHQPIQYIADFTYSKDGITYVIDVKGMLTTDYRIKKKLFLYIWRNSNLIFEEA